MPGSNLIVAKLAIFLRLRNFPPARNPANVLNGVSAGFYIKFAEEHRAPSACAAAQFDFPLPAACSKEDWAARKEKI